jgi:hypothetical protein
VTPADREEGEAAMERVDEHWPLLYAERDAGSKRNLYAFQRADFRISETEHQTYHPESAPNVLTPEEARLAASYLLSGKRDVAQSLGNRLKIWAEEEGH